MMMRRQCKQTMGHAEEMWGQRIGRTEPIEIEELSDEQESDSEIDA